MTKIILICSAGMSTSILVQKMKKVASEKGLEFDITAYPESNAQEHYDGCSIVLLGPQVRYLLNKVKKDVEGKNIKVDVIDTVSYGRMDGEAVINQINKLLG